MSEKLEMYKKLIGKERPEDAAVIFFCENDEALVLVCAYQGIYLYVSNHVVIEIIEKYEDLCEGDDFTTGIF